tara:strand:- start:61 stop:519 length:459 start_codon:yes stop_codon:yes gene_type:complete
MKRKNTRRFDPRYFMDEKTEKPKVIKEAAEETDWTRVTGLGDDPSSHPDKQEIVQKCWHKTKHLKKGEFVTAFNACMEEALLSMAEGLGDVGMYDFSSGKAKRVTPTYIARSTDKHDWVQEAANALSEEPPNVEEALEALNNELELRSRSPK